MITYVNKANADQYSFLYTRASEDLRTHDANGNVVKYGDSNALKGFDAVTLTAESYVQGRYYIEDAEKGYVICNDAEFNAEQKYFVSDDISSLDEYFSYIVQLNEINRRYTILPLDEDVFEIDANTRTITVPQSFITNGISVQGDEIAEIVYFKIRRFYDAIDLDTKDIYIQWRSAALDEKGNPIDGVSVPWVKDVESEPGYIIFGWPLSSKITAKAGTIQFAVRFYEFDKDKDILTYSLSTLTQTAVIKPALDFNLPDIILDKKLIDDATGLIRDRFENSEVQNGAVKAEEPEWVQNLAATINLAKNEETGFLEDPIQLSVQAIAPDAGQISYIWKKYGIRPAGHPRADEGKRYDIAYEITMAKIPDTEVERQKGALYFQKALDGTFILYKGSLDRQSDDYPEDGVYKKYSTGTLDSVGEYYVIATNRVRQSTATKESVHLIVPLPVKPVIETAADNLPARQILEEGKEFEVTLKPNPKVSDKGTMTYQWYRKAPGEEAFVAITGATEAELLVDGEKIDLEKPGDAATEGGVGDGYYKVEITNNLNGEVDMLTSSVCRVTHPATKCNIDSGEELNFKLTDITEGGDKLVVVATIPDASGENCQRTAEDTITYQWYRYFAGLNAVVEEDVAAADEGLYEIDADKPIEGATKPEFSPSTDGYYFCSVTNTYNGTTAVKNSRFFRIVNA